MFKSAASSPLRRLRIRGRDEDLLFLPKSLESGFRRRLRLMRRRRRRRNRRVGSADW